jgi:hypothetical protein
MKVLYEAVDGYSEVQELTEAQLLLELAHYEVTPYGAVSFDGIGKLTPDEDEAEVFFVNYYLERNL